MFLKTLFSSNIELKLRNQFDRHVSWLTKPSRTRLHTVLKFKKKILHKILLLSNNVYFKDEPFCVLYKLKQFFVKDGGILIDYDTNLLNLVVYVQITIILQKVAVV